MVGVRALRSDHGHMQRLHACRPREVVRNTRGFTGVAEGGRPALLSQLNGRASMSTRIMGPTGSKRSDAASCSCPFWRSWRYSAVPDRLGFGRADRQPEQVRVGQRPDAGARERDRQHSGQQRLDHRLGRCGRARGLRPPHGRRGYAPATTRSRRGRSRTRRVRRSKVTRTRRRTTSPTSPPTTSKRRTVTSTCTARPSATRRTETRARTSS